MSDSSTAARFDYSAWANWNIARWLAGAGPAAKPQAVIVLGQPGAGKGAICETLCRYFSNQGNCVVVDANELVYVHPDYARLAAEDLPAAANTVRPFARRLAGDLIDAAIKKRCHLVLDGPSDVPERVTKLIKTLKAAGYFVTVVALSVPLATSWESLQARHERHREQFGFPAMCEREAHDAACAALPQILVAIEQQSVADELHVLTRDGRLTYSGDRFTGYAPGAARRGLPPEFLTLAPPPPATAPIADEPAPLPAKPSQMRVPTPAADDQLITRRRAWQAKIRAKADGTPAKA